MIKIKRVYETSARDDGYRVLIDRLWPRGMTRDAAAVDRWMKAISPSRELRQWFDHDPKKWETFLERYREELSDDAEDIHFLLEQDARGTLTLVYASREERYNNAVALRSYLESLRRD